MLKHMILITMSVFGAATIAVAGTPINMMAVRPMTVSPELHKFPLLPGTLAKQRNAGASTRTNAVIAAPHVIAMPRHRPERLRVQVKKPKPGLMQRIVPVVREARLPDLVIRTAAIHPAEVCRSGAPVLYVTARVVNIGRGASAVRPSVGMVQARNIGGVNWGNGHGLPALAPGASASVRFPIYYLKSNPGYMRGTHTFKLMVNAGKWIQESHYANNGFRPIRVTLPSGFCNASNGKISATHGNMPDLIPQVSNPFNGIIKVKNIGNATAGASTLRVNCEKIGGGFASGGDCPSNAALNSLPADASGALRISVHLLHAGQAYRITLPVQGLKWRKGKYRFTYKADFTRAVAESNESNNVKTMVRQR